MSTQSELDKTYIEMAGSFAKLSKARRAQVGALLVTPHGVLLSGFNGTPRGLDNNCEHEKDDALVTKPEVIHAELNCILKAAKEGVSVVDSTVYVTLSPCVQCSAMMIQAGVKRVVYRDSYRDNSGILLLESAGVVVDKFN
jgi:dCMP deaminase